MHCYDIGALPVGVLFILENLLCFYFYLPEDLWEVEET